MPRKTAALYTLGYEGRTLAQYLALLREAKVGVLADVRRNAISHKKGFAKSALAQGCAGAGIRYEHLRALGIASDKRKGMKTEEDRAAVFAEYARAGLPAQGETLAQVEAWLRAGERVALTCFERDASRCHRHLVAEALVRAWGKGLTVVDL